MNAKQPAPSTSSLYPKLLRYLNERVTEFEAIPDDRKTELSRVAAYIRERLSKSDSAKINVLLHAQFTP